MGAYDPSTGFRHGSFAQRAPRNYLAAFGGLYVVAWFGLYLADHHAKTAKMIVAALIASVLFGVLTGGAHYATWRWRAKGCQASRIRSSRAYDANAEPALSASRGFHDVGRR
jgi:hypothetical protein